MDILDDNGKNGCYAIINTLDESLMVTIVDTKTEKLIQCYLIRNNFKQYIERIPYFFKDVEAVILNVYYFQSHEFSNNLEFRTALKAQLDSIAKPHHFMDEEELFLSCLIKNGKTTDLNFVENIAYIWRCDAEEGYGISDYQLTKNGYQKIDEREISAVVDGDENDARICNGILGSNNPQKVILIDDPDAPAVKKLQTILEGTNLKIIDMAEIFSKAIIDAGKWILSNKQEKMVIPSCTQTISVGYFFGDKYILLEGVKEGESLPVTKSCNVSKEIDEIVIAYHDPTGKPPNIFDKLSTFKDCHQNQVTLTLDEENFPVVDILRHFIEEICTLPKKLNKIMESKIPVIGICGNFSVICVYQRSRKCYNFFGSLNGLLGNDLFVSFDQEKREFGQKAMEKLKTKASFVVFDLIHIMSMSPDNLTAKPQWGFSLTKDAENPILIEFDTFDGSRKAATPAFIMSLFLKENLKAIKRETRQYPKTLGFWLYGSFFKDEKERIEKGLEDACKFLKLECQFIDA